MEKTKKLLVKYNGVIVEGPTEKTREHNTWIYVMAIKDIGAERVYNLGLEYKLKGIETDIVIKEPAKRPTGFQCTKVPGNVEYKVILLTGDEDRLRYLLEIKERLQLSDEEFTAELV